MFSQGENANRIYFVENGEFECIRTRKIKPMRANQNKLRKEKHHFLGPYKYSSNLNESEENNRRPKTQFRMDIGNKDAKEQHLIRLFLMNEGRIFGHEDVIQQRNYTLTVKCNS